MQSSRLQKIRIIIETNSYHTTYKIKYMKMFKMLCSKVTLAIVAVGLMAMFTACNNENEYTISGKITGAEGKVLRLQLLKLDGVQVIDSVKLTESGRYSFSGPKLKEPTFFALNVEKKNLTLLNDSNIKMVVSGSFEDLEDNYQITNSSESLYIKQLNNKLKSTIAEIERLKNKYAKANGATEQAMVVNEINVLVEKYKEFLADFISAHPRSFASYYALYQKYDENTFVLNVDDKVDMVSYAAIATSLNVYYPNNERVVNLYNYVLEAKRRAKSAKVSALMEAIPSIGFPDLKIADKSGREVVLSSLKGKVILLSFWASTNKDSRLFNRELKRVYNKFKSRGVEIYQVSLDNNKVYWEAALLQDELPWINVCELSYPNSYAASIYNVTQLPTNFLISKKGEIVGRNLQGTLLDDKIQENL